eukprot:Skav235999  [mRNA]  locus=scaffold348:413199:413435:+ [translate_table: standard]
MVSNGGDGRRANPGSHSQEDGSYRCRDSDLGMARCCLPGECPSTAVGPECGDGTTPGGLAVAYVTSGGNRTVRDREEW